jgi:hypothetical protein
MKSEYEKRNCKKHGFTNFKLKKSKERSWYSCEKCLKAQWIKAAAKRRKIPEVYEYQKNFNKELNKIRKSLSVYLTMILLAANIKPE